MTSHRIPAALAATAAALVLSACSNGTGATTHDGHGSGTSETSVISAEPAGFDAADVTFATNMIPHHQQAVELSALVPDRSTNTAVLALAQQISAAQQPEIDTMKAFLVQWKENPQDSGNQSPGGHGGHGDMADMGDMAGMAGMVDAATMARLTTLKGTEFDTLWLQSMIAHHQGAIEMAKAELADGRNVDAKALAQNIVTAQQGEIDQMQTMLAGRP